MKKDLAKKFAGGCSVGKQANGDEQIDIQGDYKAELPALLREWYQVRQSHSEPLRATQRCSVRQSVGRSVAVCVVVIGG